MMMVSKMDRADLEIAIFENDILPCNDSAALEAMAALSDDELRAAVNAWVEAGDECGTIEVRKVEVR